MSQPCQSAVGFTLASTLLGSGAALLLAATAATAAMGPYGPAMGEKARVVRSVSVETTGAVAGKFTGGKSDAALMGTCNPNIFANFMLTLGGGKQFDEVWVSMQSQRKIGTGATGTFRLSWMEVTFRKTSLDNFVQREFRGPGTMTLTVHDAGGKRRMTGTMESQELKGRDDDMGKKLGTKVSFDMDFSCGVK